MTMVEELIAQFVRLDEAQQQRVLAFARVLANTPQMRGEPGTSISRAVGFFDAAALDEIEAAVREGTEEIDWRDWE